ncbi:MAG: DUF86 domain-containing protein [bacterium]|nr:DUF86 domain-containing protein [bacterium]
MTTLIAFDEDVILAKASIVESCLATIRELESNTNASLDDWIRRDVEVLNIQRAAQACLDLAHHLIASNSWDLPRDTGHAMSILKRHGILTEDLETKMRAVQGFRNIAVHRYTEIDPDILAAIVDHHLSDLEEFTRAILNATLALDSSEK